jgi:ATP-dependent Lon protease
MFTNQSEQEVEFMPIVPLGEDEMDEQEKGSLPLELPIVVLRNTVLFPNVVLPITVSRDKSVKAISEAHKLGKWVGVIAQKDSNNEDPMPDDIYEVGTLAKVVKQIKMPDGNITIFIMGRMRFRIEAFSQIDPFYTAHVKYLDDVYPQKDAAFDALMSSIKEHSERIAQSSPNMPNEASIVLRNIEQQSFLMHFVASNISAKLQDKQAMLEENDVRTRAEKLLNLLQSELQLVELKNEITNRTRADIDKQQREYFLQQQLKSIREELGGEPNDREIKDLQKRAEEVKWSDAAKELFKKNIEKLERMHPSTPDYSVIYNHLDLMLDLPWGVYTEDSYNLKKAQDVLDNDHYGMDKIKDRILEYLAVLKLKGDMKSPILCFVGPPGIGKTSLGRSIANAIHRKYVRLSLGGLHDESELRGHRKTYIGAMPGRIIQSLRKVKAANPVFILDEVDKLGKDFRGDPSSALLEILDPEQNNSFYDNYLELEFDLSKILFIATANSLSDIQPALRDRLEIIQLSGYSTEEKTAIAKRHLLPKQKELHGLAKVPLKIADKVIVKMIQEYTRESGVRELDRHLAAIMRSVAKQVAMEEKVAPSVTVEQVEQVLGKPRFSNDIYTKGHPPGVVVGLAWTAVGGDILFIETALSKGKGNITMTGNLGTVMKESATTALSYLKVHAAEYNIPIEKFNEVDVHVHVPEGAVPKDGPSAGITMLTSLASAFTGKKVKTYMAMTGEITLRGQVLPVGGIKEKILAAKRAGIKDVILAKQNEKDVEEINKEFIKGMSFHYVSEVGEVLGLALAKK